MLGFPMLAALFSAATATQAGAPPAAAPPTPSDIIVQGERQKEERIRGFIDALTNVPSFGQIGRFHSSICPAVVGLPAAQVRLISDRMRRVAQAAAIRVGPANCKPNVFLMAVPDKRGAIDELYRKFPAYFSGISDKDVRRLAAAPQPVVAWQIKGRVNADGEFLKKPVGRDYYVNEGTHSASRMAAASMPDFVASIVMIELKAIGGLSVTQVADYTAMRAFADTDPRRAAGSGAPTILTILDAGENQAVPLTLTHWDLGYLKSLYTTSNAYYAGYQRGDMEHVLKKELAQTGEPGE